MAGSNASVGWGRGRPFAGALQPAPQGRPPAHLGAQRVEQVVQGQVSRVHHQAVQQQELGAGGHIALQALHCGKGAPRAGGRGGSWGAAGRLRALDPGSCWRCAGQRQRQRAYRTCQAQRLPVLLLVDLAHQPGEVLGQLLRAATGARQGWVRCMEEFPTLVWPAARGSAESIEQTTSGRPPPLVPGAAMRRAHPPLLACSTARGSWPAPAAAAFSTRCAACSPRFLSFSCEERWGGERSWLEALDVTRAGLPGAGVLCVGAARSRVQSATQACCGGQHGASCIQRVLIVCQPGCKQIIRRIIIVSTGAGMLPSRAPACAQPRGTCLQHAFFVVAIIVCLALDGGGLLATLLLAALLLLAGAGLRKGRRVN